MISTEEPALARQMAAACTSCAFDRIKRSGVDSAPASEQQPAWHRVCPCKQQRFTVYGDDCHIIFALCHTILEYFYGPVRKKNANARTAVPFDNYNLFLIWKFKFSDFKLFLLLKKKNSIYLVILWHVFLEKCWYLKL